METVTLNDVERWLRGLDPTFLVHNLTFISNPLEKDCHRCVVETYARKYMLFPMATAHYWNIARDGTYTEIVAEIAPDLRDAMLEFDVDQQSTVKEILQKIDRLKI